MTEPPEPAPPRPRLRLLVQGLLALAGTTAALWWVLSGVDLGRVGATSSRVPASTLGLVLVAQLLLHFVRSARWGLLVQPLGPVRPRQILTAASLGFSATFFFPLRLGELVRPALVARSGVPFLGAMASVVVERIVDGLTGVGLLFVLLSTLPSSTELPPELSSVGLVALGIFGGGLVALALTVLVQGPAFRLMRATLGRAAPGLFHQRFPGKAIRRLEAFGQGKDRLVRHVNGPFVTTALWAAL